MPSLTDVLPALQRRGPDATFTHTERVADGATVSFAAAALSLRGTAGPNERVEVAPRLAQSSTLLLFNGEIYDGLPTARAEGDERGCGGDREIQPDDHGVGKTSSGPVPSDTVRLHAALAGALDGGDDPLELLDGLRGPWTVVVWHAPTKRLYFGRDVIGRRSLLLARSGDGRRLVLTSAAPGPCDGDGDGDGEKKWGSGGATAAFAEVPPVGLAYIDFKTEPTAPSLHLVARARADVLPPRAAHAGEDELVSGSVLGIYVSFLPRAWLRAGRGSESSGGTEGDGEAGRAATARGLLGVLRQAVRRRVEMYGVYTAGAACGRPRLSQLFSGGVDSCVLAALCWARRCRPARRCTW